jgi:regulator of sigma E protease
MIDESMDKDQMKQEPQPWEFRSKPAWQRLIVMLGGIFVNVVAGIIAMVILTYNLGDQYLPSSHPKTEGIVAYEYAEEMGFQTGDKILNINGEDYEAFRELRSPDLFLSSDAYYTVDRNGQQIRIDIPSGMLNKMSEDDDFVLKYLRPRLPFTVTFEDVEVMNARDAGMLEGDRIVKVGDYDIEFYDQVRPAVSHYAGGNVDISVIRGGSSIVLSTKVRSDSTIGLYPESLLERAKNEYTFGEAITKGTGDAFGLVITNAKAMGKMFTGEVSPRSLSGPIGIYKIFPETWSWNSFWRTTAFISMILAFMNLLPIPALDGGHVVFLLFEMVSGKAPSDRFLENAQKVGMIMLLTLMVFVFGNDILKLFGL